MKLNNFQIEDALNIISQSVKKDYIISYTSFKQSEDFLGRLSILPMPGYTSYVSFEFYNKGVNCFPMLELQDCLNLLEKKPSFNISLKILDDLLQVCAYFLKQNRSFDLTFFSSEIRFFNYSWKADFTNHWQVYSTREENNQCVTYLSHYNYLMDFVNGI